MRIQTIATQICRLVLPVIASLICPAAASHAQSYNGLSFDGSNDYVILPTTAPVPIGNSNYTIEAWIKPDTMRDGEIIGWGAFGSQNKMNVFRITSTGLRNYWWGNDLGVNTSSLVGAWHHVAATFDGLTRKIYLDGTLVGYDQPGSVHNVPDASDLCIGRANGNASTYFSGTIDEVRVWNRALCQAEIQNNMNGELPTPASQTGLVAYYKANQGTAAGTNTGITSLADSSGNGNNGTLTNFALSGSSSNWDSGATAISGYVTQYYSPSPSSGTESVTTTISGATVFANCGTITALTPTGGGTALSGSVTTKVTVDGSVGTFHGQPYVQRHYDIEPAANATTATADVTLYFTQAEFSAYNAARGSFPALPVDSTDAANNKANLRITQFHGVPTGGNAPSNYPSTWGGSGPAHIVITPSSVTWNGSASRWEVTFPVTGFSGFFASTGNTPLPIGLIEFSAVPRASGDVWLHWRVANPNDAEAYFIERSSDGKAFAAIGSVAPSLLADYSFSDLQPLNGKSYYRLHLVEKDGSGSYSQTVAVMAKADDELSVYPTPASRYLIIHTRSTSPVHAVLCNFLGTVLMDIHAKSDEPISLSHLPAGVYLLKTEGRTFKVVKE